MKKSAFTFFSLLIFVAAGLFFIATGFLPVDEIKKNLTQQDKLSSNKGAFTEKFKRIEFQLLNHSNIANIADSINNVANDFEKKYLTALLHKRKSDYEKAFSLLFSMVKDLPAYYDFYDELIFSAKASDNINQIETLIKNKAASKYLNYLKALLLYHTNQYSASIDLLKDENDFEPLYLLSYSYRGNADYDNALNTLNRAEKLINKNDALRVKVMIAKGSLYLLSGRYDEADKLYSGAFALAQKLGIKKDEAKSLINLAILSDQNGNTDEAKNKLETALLISEAIEDKEIEATALSELAVSYTYSGNVVEAKNNYLKSFEIFNKLNHKERLSNLCANIAALYSQTGNYSAGLEYYNKGLDYAGENVASKILNLRGLGDVYGNLSNYSKSLEYYNQAKELSKKIKDAATENSVDVSIGTLYYNINKPNKALKIFSEAKEKINSSADPYFAEDVFLKIGLAYSAVDSLDKSNEALNRALNISESLNDSYYKTIINSQLGYNAFLQSDFNKAERFINTALRISKENNFNQLTGVQNLYLGKIALKKNNLSDAVSYFSKALEIAQQTMDYNNVFESEYFLAKTLMALNKIDDAEKHYLGAISIADKISESLVNNAEIQIAHFSGFTDCYSELAEIYINQKRNEEAFKIIERSRSRNTFQNLSDLKINSSGNSAEKLKKYYDVKWMLESGLFSGNKLAELNQEYVNIKNEINKSETVNFVNVKTLQENLNDKENLITFFFGKENLYSFNLTKQTIIVNKIPVTKQMAIDLLKKISPLYASDTQNNNLYFNQDLFSFNTKAANEFYLKIFRPVLNDIPAGNKLVFSLPAEFAFVPAEFLVTEFKDDDSPFYYNNKKYLIDDYAISYSPSSSIYVVQKTTKLQNENNVLLVGDPQINNKDFALSYRGSLLTDDTFSERNVVLFPLKYSKEEIQKVNSMLNNSYVLLSDNSTEKNFKDNASKSSIIHLSTHSFLYRNQPLIIFSQNKDENEDGYLESGEILQLKLHSDLVVLSSCKSGIGEIDESEGIIGMQKSFFEAGAKSVVVSLWDVNDKYTSLFMQNFYRFLSEGYSKSEALREAKIFFKNNYSANPYYWAAFVLSGDISQIKNIKSSSGNHLFYIFAGIIIFISAIYLARRKSFLR